MIGRRTLLKGGDLAAVSFGLSFPFSSRVLSQADTLMTARGVFSAPGLSYAAIFLANETGLWAKNGLKAVMRQVQGGPLTLVALTNKEADFGGIAAIDPVIAWEKGIRTLAVAAFTGSLTMQFIARNDWMSRVGISATSSLNDKLKAFKDEVHEIHVAMACGEFLRGRRASRVHDRWVRLLNGLGLAPD